MQIVRDRCDLLGVSDLAIRDCIEQRIEEISELEPFHPGLGLFAVIESCDTKASLEPAIGLHFLDEPVEWVEEHPSFVELTYVLGNAGFGIVLLIPASVTLDQSLSHLFAEHP